MSWQDTAMSAAILFDLRGTSQFWNDSNPHADIRFIAPKRESSFSANQIAYGTDDDDERFKVWSGPGNCKDPSG